MHSQTVLHNQAATSSTAAFVYRFTVQHPFKCNSILLPQESRAVAEMALPNVELQPLVRQAAQAEYEQGCNQPADGFGDQVKSRIQQWQVSHLCSMMQDPPPPSDIHTRWKSA